MELKAGARFRSVVDDTEVVVVRKPATEVDLRCGGHPMVPLGGGDDGAPAAGGAAVAADHCWGTKLGKRYADDGSGLEVLCTKGGEGSLALGNVRLSEKDAKPLPSSD